MIGPGECLGRGRLWSRWTPGHHYSIRHSSSVRHTCRKLEYELQAIVWMAVACTPAHPVFLPAGLWTGGLFTCPHVPGSPARDTGPCRHALLQTSSRQLWYLTPLPPRRKKSLHAPHNTFWLQSVCRCGVILCLLFCLPSSVWASTDSFQFTLYLQHHTRCLAEAGALWTPVRCPAKPWPSACL